MTSPPAGGIAPEPHDPDRQSARPTPYPSEKDSTTSRGAPAVPDADPAEVDDVLREQQVAEVREEIANEMRLAQRARTSSANIARKISRHLPWFEPGEDLEDGGPLLDDADAPRAEWRAEGSIEAGPIKIRGKSAGPAALAPLLVWFALIVIGAVIWATSNWIPGAAVMILGSVMLLLHHQSRRKGR